MEEVKEIQIATCFDCRKKFDPEEIRTYLNQVLCESCWDLNMGFCESCNESVRNDDLREIKDKWYCGACVEKKFVACSSCEEYVARDHAIHSEIHEADYCQNCAGDYLRYCAACDSEVNNDSCYHDDSGDAYCGSCWDNREQNGDAADYIQHHELSGSRFERCVSKRKFGVEIEACLDSEDAEHLPVDRVGKWSSQHDGSLGDGGREYASPILQGDEGFQEIEEFCLKLKSWDYFIQKSCGLHVHIDGRDLGCEDIRKLLKIVLTYEPVIYAMLPETRYTGSYSVPLTKFPKSRFRTRVISENDLKAVWYGRDQHKVDLKSKYHHSRYYGVNIHSWFFRRSVEFRYHSGTLNPVKIINFIRICQALVDKAHAVKFAKVRKFEHFQEQYENFISFLGLTPELALYIKQRILKFHPDRFGLTPVQAQ